MNRRLFIRTDMNSVIATGHMMRCLSIAEAARGVGINVTFILADSTAVELVSNHGHNYVVLESNWKELDEELPKLKKCIEDLKITYMLIDSYYVTKKYLSELSSLIKTTYIDDLKMFEYPVDKILCYTNYYKKLNYNNYQKDILGLEYVPLRQEFESLPPKSIRRDIQKVLVMSGGADETHFLPSLVEELYQNTCLELFVVCGRFSADYESMYCKYMSARRVNIYKALDNLIEYMLEADIAISAGGTTLYELCACGTPTITYSFVDNQINNVMEFAEAELMNYAGDVRNTCVAPKIIEIIKNFSFEERAWKSSAMQKAVDGKGAKRIVKRIFEE